MHITLSFFIFIFVGFICHGKSLKTDVYDFVISVSLDIIFCLSY